MTTSSNVPPSSKNASRPRAPALDDPEVDRTIRGILRKRGMKDDASLDEGVQEVKTRALVTVPVEEWETRTVDGWTAVCVPLAQNLGTDEYRKTQVRSKRIEAGDPDEIAPSTSRRFDPVDARKAIAVVREHLEAKGTPGNLLAVFDAIAAGEEQEAIAPEFQKTAGALRKQVARGREGVRKRMVQAGLAALLVAGGVAIGVQYMRSAGQEAQAPRLSPRNEAPVQVEPTARPNAPEPQASAQPQEEETYVPGVGMPNARQIRQKAFSECYYKEWKACLQDLAAADDLDPHGAQDPGVQEAREKAMRALHPELFDVGKEH